jgi:hypothetical protein
LEEKKQKPYIIIKVEEVRKGRRNRMRANHTHMGTNYHNEDDG